MDKKYIEDNEIGIKYLRKQLVPEELEAFEIYLMENPEMVDELEVDILLMESSETKHSRVNNSLIGGRGNQGSRFLLRRKGLFISIYTGVAMVFFFASFAYLNLRDNSDVVYVVLHDVRSVNKQPWFNVVPKKKMTTIFSGERLYGFEVFVPEEYFRTRFQVSLFKLSNTTKSNIAHFAKEVESNESGLLLIEVPAEKMRQGLFKLSVFDSDATYVKEYFVEVK